MYDALDTITRECYRSFSALPDAQLIDAHGAFGVINDIPLTFFNGIATAHEPSIPEVMDIYRRRGRAFRWWVRDGVGAEELVAHGMRFGWNSPGMVIDLLRMPEVAPPPELTVVRALDVATMQQWATMVTTVFERPVEDRATWLSGFVPLGLDGDWAHFVGYVDGQPVATTTVLSCGDVAGIYHVGALASVRGRGIGSAVTRAALMHARARGAKEAALQSSEMAVSVYRALGFEARCTLTMYDWKPEPESSQ